MADSFIVSASGCRERRHRSRSRQNSRLSSPYRASSQWRRRQSAISGRRPHRHEPSRMPKISAEHRLRRRQRMEPPRPRRPSPNSPCRRHHHRRRQRGRHRTTMPRCAVPLWTPYLGREWDGFISSSNRSLTMCLCPIWYHSLLSKCRHPPRRRMRLRLRVMPRCSSVSAAPRLSRARLRRASFGTPFGAWTSATTRERRLLRSGSSGVGLGVCGSR